MDINLLIENPKPLLLNTMTKDTTPQSREELMSKGEKAMEGIEEFLSLAEKAKETLATIVNGNMEDVKDIYNFCIVLDEQLQEKDKKLQIAVEALEELYHLSKSCNVDGHDMVRRYEVQDTVNETLEQLKPSTDE